MAPSDSGVRQVAWTQFFTSKQNGDLLSINIDASPCESRIPRLFHLPFTCSQTCFWAESFVLGPRLLAKSQTVTLGVNCRLKNVGVHIFTLLNRHCEAKDTNPPQTLHLPQASLYYWYIVNNADPNGRAALPDKLLIDFVYFSRTFRTLDIFATENSGNGTNVAISD